MGCGASNRQGPIVWSPGPDDGDTQWMEDIDVFMTKLLERGWKSPTGAALNAAQLGLLDPPFEAEGDLEQERMGKEWAKFKEAVIKDWQKRSAALCKSLTGEALDSYNAKLEAREMPGLGDNAVSLGKLMLHYQPLQIRAIQFAAYRKKADQQESGQEA